MFSDSAMLDFLEDARSRLINYYVEELRQSVVGKQVKFFGQQKRTIMRLLEWSYETDHKDELIRLMDTIGRPMGILGYMDERLLWGERSVKACKELNTEQTMMYSEWFSVHDVAWAKARLGQYEDAMNIWQTSLSVAEERGYKNVEALALRNLSQMKSVRQTATVEDRNTAISNLRRSIRLWEELDEPEWGGHTLRVLGLVLRLQGNRQEALEVLQKALQLLTSQEHIDGIISTLSDMSIVEYLLGHEDKAIANSEKAIEQAVTALNPPAPAHAYALWQRAELMAMAGQPHEVVIKWAREAVNIYEASFANYWASEAKKWLEDYLRGAVRNEGLDAI